MNTAYQPMYEWNTLPWRTIERTVFKLQKRIYQASQNGNTDLVHKLQRLLIHSWSARMSGGTPGHTGQSGQEDCRGRWRQIALSPAAHAPGSEPEG